MKKVYFAGSIRGGREDAQLYKDTIDFINQTAVVLTEQVGDMQRSLSEQSVDKDALIYIQDTNWLKECDVYPCSDNITCFTEPSGFLSTFLHKYPVKTEIFSIEIKIAFSLNAALSFHHSASVSGFPYGWNATPHSISPSAFI